MSLLDTPRRLLHEWSTRRKNQRTIAALEAQLGSRDPILLVHQMGRAGSMTTVNTLRNAGLNQSVFHTHWLNPKSVAKNLERVKDRPESRRPLNLRVSARISAQIRHEGADHRDWKLVSVFREPIARNISVFFLCIDEYVPDFQRRYRNGSVNDRMLMDIFLDRFPHEQPLEWFKEDIGEVFGIDVYDQPFPMEQGYRIMRTAHTELLLIKLEHLNQCYQNAFQDFLHTDIPSLAHTHVTELDPTKPMYVDFVRNAVLPADYLDQMYDSAFARHFYSDQERETLRRKWSLAEK